MSVLKSLRIPALLLGRIESIARSKHVKFSAALRFALERGVSAMEREADPAPPVTPIDSRRRVLSRGV